MKSLLGPSRSESSPSERSRSPGKDAGFSSRPPLLAAFSLSMMQPTRETSDELGKHLGGVLGVLPKTAIIDELIKEDGFAEDPGSARASLNEPPKLIPRSTDFTPPEEMRSAGRMCLLQNGLEPYGVLGPPAPPSPQDSFPQQLSQNLNNLSLRSQLVPRGLLPPSRDLDAPWTAPGPSGCATVGPEPLDDGMRDLPELVIIEQPKQRGMRFRYQCEGRSAGSILGEGSSETNKTLPTIELQNFEGVPEVKVTACLVWKDWPYQIHPHSLVGKDCSNGLCEVTLKPRINARHSFNNLGIQCVKKKDIEESIEKKLQLGIDPFKAGSLKNHQEVDMNVVRICFQASYQDSMGKTWHLSPVLSEPIFDKKSTNTSELKIYRMNKEQGTCTGGEEFYLLCDKVQKEDISVIFRKDAWEGKADFSQADVHRQIAIVFKTPPYQHLDILEPVEVEVYLRRLTDSVSSEPFPFTYLPKDTDTYRVNKKRKQGMPDVLEELSGPDPHGIEAKRKKKKPDYLDHFNLTPSADFSLSSPEDRGFLPSMDRITLPDLYEEFGRFPGFSPYGGPSLSDVVLPSATNYAERAEQEFLLDAYSVHSGITIPLALPEDSEPEGVAALVGSSMFPSQYKEEDGDPDMENPGDA